MQRAEQHQTDPNSTQQSLLSSQRKNNNLSILLELMTFIRPYRWKVVAALMALIVTASLTLSVGQGVRLLIDQGFAQQSTQELSSAIQLIVALTVMI